MKYLIQILVILMLIFPVSAIQISELDASEIKEAPIKETVVKEDTTKETVNIKADRKLVAKDISGLAIKKTDSVEEVTNQFINKVTSYFYLNNMLLSSKNHLGTKYYHQDRLGNNRLITDENGETMGEIKTLPFGQEILNTADEIFTFTGKELDRDLYYFKSRYYDPNLGMFISKDPVESEPDYIYVRNNPMNSIDPDGEFPISLTLTLTNYAVSMLKDKEKIKETTIKQAASTAVKAVEKATGNMDSVSKNIINGNARAASIAVKTAASEDPSAKELGSVIVEEAIRSLFVGPLGGPCYGACKEAWSNLMSSTGSTSLRNPENIIELKERHQAKIDRPIYNAENYPSISVANKAHEQKWLQFLARQDTLTMKEAIILEEYGIKLRGSQIITPNN